MSLIRLIFSKWIPVLIVLFSICFDLGCQSTSFDPQSIPSEIIQSNGKIIKIISKEQRIFPKTGVALVVTYYTNVKIEQKIEMQEEVMEIWKSIKPDAENGHFESVALRALESNGSNKGFGFVFLKVNGNWQCDLCGDITQ